MNKNTQLEDSKLWQLAKKVAEEVREAVKAVPYMEHYIFAGSPISAATGMVSDVAYAVGRGQGAASYDYEVARGNLFKVKSLLIMASDLGYVENTTRLMADMDKLQVLIETELAKIEKAQQESKK